jgi:hypothetical protein
VLTPAVDGIPIANALVAGSSGGTVAAGCTAIVGRLIVGANAANVARPSASEE